MNFGHSPLPPRSSYAKLNIYGIINGNGEFTLCLKKISMQKQKPIKQNNLFFLLSDVEDFRREQGRMHSLPIVLLIFIMAAMSGFNGFRPTGDFIKKHQQELIKLFKPKNDRLPSFQTIARILENIDFDKLTKVFYRWASSRVIIKKSEWCSLDGKAIGGTVKNSHNCHQQFTSLVSVFSSK